MKQQLSVFGLHARAALNRLLLAALGLLAVELILVGVCMIRGTAITLAGSDLEHALQYPFRAGILALQVLLASCFGSNSRYGYTLRRLRVSERCVFLWSCACNALCYVGAQFDIRAGAWLRDRAYAAWNAQKGQPQLAGLHGDDVSAGAESIGSVYSREKHRHIPCDYGAACRARLSGIRADADTGRKGWAGR